MHLMGLKGVCLREERPFKESEDLLISQSSTFFGTQTSKRICPRTPCALMLDEGLGRWISPSLC